MFNFAEQNENENELLQTCQDLFSVANDLDLDTGWVFGLGTETTTDQLLGIQQALEEAIEEANQETLLRMGRCCMGYKWQREGDHYRCEGGTHTVTLEELKRAQGGATG